MKTKIKQELWDHQVTHQYSGNGWAIVQELPNEMCRVAGVGPKEIGKQAFLAWTHLLKPETFVDAKTNEITIRDVPIEAEEQLDQLRQGFRTGVLAVKNTRIVPA